MVTRLLLFILLPVLFSNCQASEPRGRISGKVVRILDGDTFELLTAEKRLIKIRMNGIDAPEKKQAFGEKSKDYLGSLCFGKTINVDSIGTDRYKRILGVAYTPTQTDINAEMVKAGLAWHYVRYSKDQQLAAAERAARAAKRGLWVDPHAVAPWEFRQVKRRK